MRITRIKISQFGNIMNGDWSLTPGLTVFSGGNGTGKTTISQFIFGMLYGFPGAKSAADNLYELPGDRRYGGVLFFSADGIDYQLSRFGRTKTVSSLVDLTNGRTLLEVNEALTKILGPVDRGLYQRLFYFDQANLMQIFGLNIDDFNDAVMRLVSPASSKLLRMATIADKRAASLFGQTKTARRPINVFSATLNQSRQRMMMLEQQEPNVVSTLQEQNRLRHQLEIVTAEKEKAVFEERRQVLLSQVRALDAELQLLDQKLVEQRDGIPQGPRVENHANGRARVFGLVLTIVLIVPFLFAGRPLWAVMAGLLGIGLSLLVPKNVSQSLHDSRRTAADVHVEEKHRSFEADRQALLIQRNKLAAQIADIPASPVSMQNVSQQESDLQTRLAEVTAKISQQRKNEQFSVQAQAVAGQVADLERQLMVYFADKIAAQTLERLAAEVAEMHPKALLDSAAEILSRLTNGAFVRLIQDNQSLVVRRDSGEQLPIKHLSKGTAEQVYMAIRLAAILSIPLKFPLPWLMDDAFVEFDGNRYTAMLDTLSDLADNEQQIIYFTTGEPQAGELIRLD
jgi:uncharacterized protein YhaN